MGLDRRFPRTPIRTDTIFRIFSMTKPVTGLAMGILADRGLWRPDDAVADHLPELRNLRVVTGFDDRGAPILADPVHPPTMRELMTHTAGFTYGRDRSDPLRPLYRKERPLRARDLDDLVARVSRLPLAYQPGTSRRYSISMDLQGAIVERLSGQSLPDFFREHIVEPLGMTDTAFHTPPGKRRAVLHRRPAAAGAEPARPRLECPARRRDERDGAGLDDRRLRAVRSTAARSGRMARPLGMIQLLSNAAPPLQKITQALLDPGTPS